MIKLAERYFFTREKMVLRALLFIGGRIEPAVRSLIGADGLWELFCGGVFCGERRLGAFFWGVGPFLRALANMQKREEWEKKSARALVGDCGVYEEVSFAFSAAQ
ncbi:hypothetical protein [Bartonella tribocorum]|uniref:hypothetical protein n=1 Tax=Bartonella tribocorum TaxID=85701 RepID=UPI001ABA7316|nr:hypothetical protein [Bartonella tribocorum]